MQIKHGEDNLMDTYNEISLAMLVVLTCGSSKLWRFYTSNYI